MPRALVPLADGCEEMEAITIIDILRRAGVEVVTAGLVPGVVTASRGTRHLPDATLDEVAGQAWDLIALPGGLPGADHLAASVPLGEALRDTAAAGGVVAAICAAPKVLAAHGLLDGRRATAYPGCVEWGSYPEAKPTKHAVEVDGNVITSRGPGTAMDFALALVEALRGKAVREETEARLVRTLPDG